ASSYHPQPHPVGGAALGVPQPHPAVPYKTFAGTGRFADNAELAFLERNCYPWNKQAVWNIPPSAIRLMSAAGPREELAAAGREILRLVREEGLRYRDISVIARETAPYEDLLPVVFGDLDIPYFVDSPKTLLYHPVVELTRSALEIWAGQAHYRHIFRYLKTGLTPLTPPEINVWENYCLANIRGQMSVVRGRKEHVGDAALGVPQPIDEPPIDPSSHPIGTSSYHPQTHPVGAASCRPLPLGVPQPIDGPPIDPSSHPVGASSYHPQTLGVPHMSEQDMINELRWRGTAALADFLSAAPAAEGDVDGGLLLQALLGLLLDLEVEQTLSAWSKQAEEAGRAAEAAVHRQAYEKLLDFLNETCSLLEGSHFGAQQLLAMIDAGCAALTLSLIPPGLDQVLVASLERSRNPELRAAIVLGVNADHLPKKVQPEALLADYERNELQSAGLELAPSTLMRQMAEHYLAYIALTRSGQRLMLIYALSDGEGRALLPSPLIKRLRALFPQLVEERYSEAQGPDGLSGGAATLSVLARQLAAAREGQPLDGFWNDVYNWYAKDEQWRGPLQRLLQGLNLKPGQAQLSAATLSRLYGGTLKSSVSRLEKFRACPFAYFAAYGLKLKPRSVYEITPLERGEIFHQALALIGQRISEGRATEDGGQVSEEYRSLSWQALDEGQAAALVDEALHELTPVFLSGILSTTARYRYLAARIRGTLIATVLLLAEHMRRGHFVPVAWELPFGSGEKDALPALIIELGEGKKLEINGRIDRVDMARGENTAYFRIVDYKTGDTTLRLEDIFNGLRLQLLVYLQVVLDNSAYFQQGQATPAGMYYMPVRDEYALSPMPPEREKAMPVGLKLKGLTVKDEQAVRLADPDINGHSRLIPAALSAKGFYSNSPGLDTEQFASLREYLPRLLRDTAAEMLSGLTAAQPCRSAAFDACAYCDYHTVCGFDRAISDA
ncbi:MAG: PD-(D/E)XK nuclease family protein, partial [Clostridiales bacterium]|nr:PD-(D/E)XK nuclease family protein [Clostridiales bacterium]